MYYLNKYIEDDNPVFEMRNMYLRNVGAFDVDGLSQAPWTYDYFLSGEHINFEVRNAYRNQPRLVERCPNPYGQSNSSLSSESVYLQGKYRKERSLARVRSVFRSWRQSVRDQMSSPPDANEST
jgi:hypothetical protein